MLSQLLSSTLLIFIFFLLSSVVLFPLLFLPVLPSSFPHSLSPLLISLYVLLLILYFKDLPFVWQSLICEVAFISDSIYFRNCANKYAMFLRWRKIWDFFINRISPYMILFSLVITSCTCKDMWVEINVS